MSSTAIGADLAVSILVLALLVRMQLITRRLSESYRLPLILAVLGIVQFAAFLNGRPHDTGRIAAAVAVSLVLAAVFGGIRALTVRVWRQDGQLLRKGTWLTAAGWAVSYAAHLGCNYLVAGHVTGKNGSNVGEATTLLYLVITLTVQRFALLKRAARREAAGTLPTAGPKASLDAPA